ncbi:MAG TPA: ankyrin repeat domain-containing protein [Candidatus Syntrophosphaera sp.]|nr:ankyrin repeat domain-containing protein [Candidatus Syntrophosphaera sp.]
MKLTLILVLLALLATVSAFDLEYIKPVPLEGDSKSKTEVKEKPRQSEDVVLRPATPDEYRIEDALAYVKSLDYRTYDWELIKHAYLGNTEVVRVLLDRDANCIHWDQWERIALFYAAECRGNQDVVAKVREHTDLIYRDWKWRTAAIYAAVHDNVEVLEWLLDNYGRYEDAAEDYSDRDPGAYAAANGCLDMVRQIVERKIKFCDPAGMLDYAIAAGAADIVDYLVNTAGVAVNASDLVIAAGGVDSFYAWEIPEMEVRLFDPGLLLVEGYEVSELGMTYDPDSYKAIFDMLVSRVDVNARDSEGKTPLIACTMQNDFEGAKALIGLGASPFLRFEGRTPLDYALDYPETDPRLVELLRSAMR